LEYFEEEGDERAKLYNRDVLKLLFRYVTRYRKYFLVAIVFVFFITGANLAVPFLFKTIIDRSIYKQGRIVNHARLEEIGVDRAVTRRIGRSVPLEGPLIFMYQSDLKLFSKAETNGYIESGIFSSEKFLIVSGPFPDADIRAKIENLLQEGDVREFGEQTYLFRTSILNSFRIGEIVLLRKDDFKRIVQIIFLIVGILLIQFGSSYLQIIFLMKLSQSAMKDLRRDLFSHILSLEVSYFDHNPIGRLVNRVTNDIERLNELFSSVLITLFQDILLLIGITLIMFLTSVTLALIVAITFPFLILFTILFRIKVRNAYRKIRTKISELNSFLNETITGIRIVQIFVKELANFKKFTGINNDVYSAQMGQLYINGIFRPLIGFMMWFAIAAVLYFGAQGIVQNRVSFGILVMFIAYIERFFHPIRDLSEKFDIMQSATAAGEKILSIFRTNAVREIGADVRPAGKTPGSIVQRSFQGRDESHFRGKIEFRDVWFSYKPGEWVLRGVSFTVNPRETLAIVGETGAGKSTIINILSKFYRIQQGRILIDGMDIEDLPYDVVRKNIIAVMQDVFLFSRQVRENVTLGGQYREAWFREVSGITHIDRFIDSLPNGLDEPVMERGATFSAGERQLLSFARALYADPAILVLDEATSSIDTETERLIQDAIIGLMKGRTSIVIAHRLSTIKHANWIVVIDKGRIVERGGHEELLEKKGLYHRLYTLQFGSHI
jgi:ATP-binding cassette subfamily B protein/subfamily B ATP-binding cassette protein MsbA